MTATDRPGGAAGRDESTEFLLQSLRDLEQEHEAGDIDDDDYRTLRDDYTARAAAALRAEQRGQAPPVPPSTGRSPLQWALTIAGVVAFAVLCGLLVAQASGRRLAGDGITGEITSTPTQQAARCIGMTQAGDFGDAVECYSEVLDEDPDNAVAHAYLGWTVYLTAGELPEPLRQQALASVDRSLERAVEADPRYADARAFRVLVAERDGRLDDARAELAVLDELDAPVDLEAQMRGVRERLAAAEAEGTEAEDPADAGGDGPAPTSTP